MSLPELSPQMDLYSAEQFLAADFDPADPYRLFSEKVYPLLLAARSALAQAYCQCNGRPATEPVLMLGVSILQFVYRLPDRAAAQNLKYHLGWKLALHRPLGLESFDPSGLVYFRQRLIGHEKAKLAFDAVLQGLKEAGLVKAGHKQRLDSTYVLGLVSEMSAAERLRETLRLALRELAEAQALPRPPFWAELWERYVQGKLDWQLPETELKAKFQEAGQDMQRVREWLTGQYPVGLELPQVKLLARVFGENFQQEQGALTVRVQPPGAVKNPHDPDAQWSRKGKETDWVGYKVQVAETVNDQPLQKGEPTRSLVTAMATQPATGSDEAGLKQVRTEQEDSGLPLPPALLVDSAYVSAQVLKEEAEAGRELIGPAPDTGNKGPGFKSEAFDVNISGRVAVCPAGTASSNCSRLQERESGKASFRFEWGKQCRDCPLKDQCVGKNQPHRTLNVGEHHEHLQQRRREQKTDAFKQRLHQRNAIEGTQSELVRGHGLRQARYRGLPKVRLQNYLIGAACNVKRWLAHVGWEIRQGVAAVSGARTAAVTS
jgi:transposase